MSKNEPKENEVSIGPSDVNRRSFLKGLAVAGTAAAVGVSGCLDGDDQNGDNDTNGDDNGDDNGNGNGGTTPVYLCPFCDEEFESEEALREHIESSHQDDDDDELEPKAGLSLMIDYQKCTGCKVCEQVCAEKWQEKLTGEENPDTLNFEYARIRTTRFQFVDTVNVCRYCTLEDWAEGTTNFPCAEVCPPDCIETVPEGEGEEGFTGMGYKSINRNQCLGLDDCGKCLEICEEQFGSNIMFDPEERLAQVCTRCGGVPECYQACPENAIRWASAAANGRYYARTPTDQAEMLYRKLYGHRREI